MQCVLEAREAEQINMGSGAYLMRDSKATVKQHSRPDS